jgi:hypothetical protein
VESENELRLSDDDITVLGYVLNKLIERDDFSELVPNDADRLALNGLLNMLEPLEKFAFDPAYESRLQQAREAFRPND